MYKADMKATGYIKQKKLEYTNAKYDTTDWSYILVKKYNLTRHTKFTAVV